eukprot:Seg236.1 transcript_id=Seg236.1/GoldUCD/mRNA.D3Y31 product="Zinc finger MYM-type protein 1" protein_id=Seg236.1/GoldUCD/D3Y31
MRGKYNGVKTRIQKESPQCLFIWTFDHVLNLVIMEACGSSLPAKVLFGTLEKLCTFFSTSRKRSDILQDIQKEADLGKLHRPQRVSTTLWWSHQKALDTVFFAQSSKLYDCFRDASEHCLTPEHSKETVTDAEALVQKISSFEMVITAHLFKKIFTITDPASSYLQSEKIDILTAIRLVETVQSQLVTLRGEFENVVEEAKELCAAHELKEHDFTERRQRKKRRCQVKFVAMKRRKTLEVATEEKLLSLRLTRQYPQLEGALQHTKKFLMILHCWTRRGLQTSEV